MSIDPSEHESVPASDYQDSSEGFVGIASEDDDGDEAQWARERDEEKVGRGLENLSKINSLAGIVDTDAPGLVPLRSARSGDKVKKSTIRLRDLPSELQANFGKLFTPALIRYVASLPPWQNPEAEEVAEIWDPLFPENELAHDQDLETKVLKLANDKITAYRNMFSTTEVKALDEVYANKQAKTPEARAVVVELLLEGDDRGRAFYYRNYADDEGNVIQKGLFQGHLIIRGLAAHYAAIRSPNDPVEDPETTEFPETPLVYTIQAVCTLSSISRADWKLTPVRRNVLSPTRLGNFSRENWADKMEYREGKSVMVNTTSGLVAIAAIEASLPKKRERGHKVEVIDVDAVAAADFELVDNDSDWYVPLISA
ncbi:hypothetical protein B0H13DRAFT_2302127 [Mycena leptocephala]|nr:hypothetical protein B0H13DRAFT_2302127 [Mycena leptocephala]